MAPKGQSPRLACRRWGSRAGDWAGSGRRL